jgi:hypothetical protein
MKTKFRLLNATNAGSKDLEFRVINMEQSRGQF